MAFQNDATIQSYKSAETSVNRYRFQKLSAAGSTNSETQVTTATSANDTVLGISQNKVETTHGDKTVNVRMGGVCKLEVDATIDIAAGDFIQPAAAGKGVKADSVDGAGCAAIAMEPATADGDIISVFLMPQWRHNQAWCKVIQTGGMAVNEICIVDATETTGGVVAVKDTANDTSIVFGVLTETVAEDAFGYVQTDGIALVKVNGNSVNIASGDELEPAAGGVGVKAGAASTTAQQIFGQALAASSADGDVIPVLLYRRLNLAAA